MEADGSPAAAAPPAPQEQQLRRSSSDASSGRSSDSSDGADSASGSEDDESGSDSESSSEDDLSDNETLASRHKKRASAAAEQAVKRRRSSSDTGSGSSSHRRKRRNLFPVIRKSQRCGKCHTCTNPQLKKACLTVREQMMREATKGSKKSKGSAPAAPPAAASSSRPQAGSSSSSGDVDKYTDLLLPFINSAGGISDVASVQPFIKAMGSFSSSLARMLPCTVLGLSSAAVLAEFMARGGVDVLSGWMLTAMQEDSEQASQFLAEALSALKKLPVTKGFVQGTKSAKVIGALRKHDSSDVRRLSRDVVALWMKAIPAGAKPAGAAASKASAAGEQREAALAAAALPAAKRLKTSGQELPTPAAAGGLQQQRLGANGAAARGAAAAAGAGAVSGIHVVSDNDLFKPKTPQRLGMAAKQQKKPGLVQTLDPAEASRLLGGKASAAAGQADAGQQQQQSQPPEPYVQVQITVNPDPASDTPLKVTLKLLHPLAAAAAAKRAAAAAAAAGGAGSRGPTTSSVSRLPGVRRQFGAGLGARPGAAAAAAAGTTESGGSGSSISALLGGSWVQPGGSGTAAAAAAGGAEGGEPAAKRARKGPVKRVAWKAEHDLVAVRWFVKEDPPAQACKDAHLTDEQLRALAAAHQHPHAAFDQAARMEHQRERQIIEQQHREAEEEAARLRQQVDAMQPAMEWYGAPPEVPLDPAWQVAAGEDSTEAQRHTRTLPQLLTKLASAPPPLPGEPQESHQLLQPPNALFNVAYHDRNVKIIPLSTVVQQQPAPPPPQQQQQPVVLQAPLQQQPVPMQQQQQQPQPQQQQLQQPPMLNVQPQPGQYEQPGHVYEQQGHMQHMGRHEYGQQQWDRPQYEGGGGGYRGHGGGHVREDWRRSKRECKFFATAAGCKKGDACTFKHFAIVDGKTMDVRETRR
ncbi:hypothetical protein OEZ85_001853 [Tetradesmus obliquus]|uniref:Serine/threonine-protein phosphatase 1 regulatory subunit 10 n=1 Tax=Tetradesmus obliquus TaxID=3088 RepID=A0ABY8U669_TETOB|nr:hypothetical protein OEZ85_001853 [Tetradesmus obliquus]